MSERHPRLTIGLPVYNGEQYLRQALDSILGQTFTDFTLILSDNASTDATERICREAAAHDNRVRYERLANNIGAAGNFNRVFALAETELFKWAAHDDVLAKDFLEKCVRELDRDPNVVLAYSRVAQIGPDGQVEGSYDYPMRVSDPNPVVRFRDLTLTNHFCVAVFGVMRRAVLAQTPLIDSYVGSDRILLAELALHGPLFEVPEYLFYRRDHPETSGRKFSMYRRLAWFNPKMHGKLYFPYWRMGGEFARAAWQAAPSAGVRTRALWVVARWFGWRRRQLLEDVKAALVVWFPLLRGLMRPAGAKSEKGRAA